MIMLAVWLFQRLDQSYCEILPRVPPMEPPMPFRSEGRKPSDWLKKLPSVVVGEEEGEEEGEEGPSAADAHTIRTPSNSTAVNRGGPQLEERRRRLVIPTEARFNLKA